MHTTNNWPEYIEAIWQRRFFWGSLVKLDLRSRYRRSFLGMGWSLLQPIAMTVVLCVVFRSILNVEIQTYAPFLLSGLAIWNFISCAISEGCQSLILGEKYIRTQAAPIAIYPLRTILGVTFHFLLTLLVTLLATALMAGFTAPWTLAAIVPAVGLFFLFGWALATIFGFINIYFPDMQYLSQVGLQLLFYLTPIMYPPEMLDNRRIGNVLQYNPLSKFVALIREPILYGRWPTAETWGICILTVAITACVAITVLRRGERRIIFHM